MAESKMSIVTKTGDDGTTGVVGGARLPKDHPRLHAYGTVDELNALLGVVIAEGVHEGMAKGLRRIQHMLFQMGADLATPHPLKSKRIEARHVEDLESWIRDWEEWLPELKNFILPGGSKTGALLHHARTVCRRAERDIVALSRTEIVNPQVRVYLNRLGDLLFLLARAENHDAKEPEIPVVYD